MEGDIPATVHSMDAGGNPFETETTLDNLSASGLHVCVNRQVETGTSLCANIRLMGMEVEAHGEVMRVECQPEGTFGLGVAFSGYRVHSSWK